MFDQLGVTSECRSLGDSVGSAAFGVVLTAGQTPSRGVITTNLAALRSDVVRISRYCTQCRSRERWSDLPYICRMLALFARLPGPSLICCSESGGLVYPQTHRQGEEPWACLPAGPCPRVKGAFARRTCRVGFRHSPLGTVEGCLEVSGAQSSCCKWALPGALTSSRHWKAPAAIDYASQRHVMLILLGRHIVFARFCSCCKHD